MKKNTYMLLLISLFFLSVKVQAEKTIEINSCNRQILFENKPKRALSHDINITQMMLALGLQGYMIGYSGIEPSKDNQMILNRYPNQLKSISEDAPSLELLLSKDVDFFFAGWNYGLKVGGALTPTKLRKFGINVYELSESCIHIMDKKDSGFADIYNDLENLGKIFRKEKKAKALIADIQRPLSQLPKLFSYRPKVFVFDSGFDRPFTSGKYGMPNKIIHAAGGINIFDDLPKSWTSVNWESVIKKDPDIIIIVDYGELPYEQKIEFLMRDKSFKALSAVKNQRYFILSYNEMTPSLETANTTLKLHHFLHPDTSDE